MSGSGSGGWDPTGVGEDFRDGVLFREARSLSNGGTVSTAFPPIHIALPCLRLFGSQSKYCQQLPASWAY